jgi:hypothetical protein
MSATPKERLLGRAALSLKIFEVHWRSASSARAGDLGCTQKMARAYLWAACEFDLHQAVDKLQHDAVASGLVAEIGQDAVQAIMAEAFGRVR